MYSATSSKNDGGINMRLKVKAKPQLWDKKIVVKFAWFPKRVQDTIVWLEKYECTYRYTKDSFWDYYYWEAVDKVLLNKQD